MSKNLCHSVYIHLVSIRKLSTKPGKAYCPKTLINPAKNIVIMPIEQSKMQLILQELVRRTNDELARIRDLEDRVVSLEERLGTLEEVSLQRTKRFNDKFAEIEITVRNVSDETAKIKNIVEKVGKQLGNVALKRDVRELERMFDLLSPVRNEAEVPAE